LSAAARKSSPGTVCSSTEPRWAPAWRAPETLRLR
jgi:hypothetical protein